MDSTDPVAAFFAKARKHHVTIGTICQRADVARSTPSRWKGAHHAANLSTLTKLNTALDEIITEQSDEAEAAAA